MASMVAKAHRQSVATNEWSGRCFLAALAHLGVPHSLLDVGCGDGHLVEVGAQLGIAALGIDLLVATGRTPHGGELCTMDLKGPADVGREFDLMLCWEVAEHLPAVYTPRLLEFIACHLQIGGTLLWTAAIPGQGGSGHVNERTKAFWRSELERSGLVYHSALTDRIVATWKDVSGPAWWYPQNLQVFVK